MWKKGPPEHYHLMDMIFENQSANGMLARSSTQQPLTSDDERALEDDFIGNGGHNKRTIDIEDQSDEETLSSKQPVPSATHSSRTKKRGKSRESADLIFAKGFDQMTSALNSFAASKLSMNAATSSSCSDPHTIPNCIARLDTIPNLSDEVYFKATMVLKDDAGARAIFMSMPEDRMKYWVQNIDKLV